jgi:hypothetical protein
MMMMIKGGEESSAVSHIIDNCHKTADISTES